MSLTQSILISILIMIGLYLGLNSILAIPLIDEDKTKTKELSLSLKDELNSIKTTSISHMIEVKYDSLTLQRFDSINNFLGFSNTSASLTSNLSNRITNQKFLLENYVDLFYYDYLNKNMVGLNSKKKYKNSLDLALKEGCSKADSAFLNSTLSARLKILTIFSFAKIDTSPGHKASKEEFRKLVSSLNSDPIVPALPKSSTHDNPFLKVFFIANSVVNDESQTLAIIYWLIGLGLLGAIIGTFGRASSTQNANTKTSVVDNIFNTIIKSFSASIVSYLSIKGGLSIISTSTDVNPNPYFVLFVCFTAAVYSEEIWQWAKKKIFPV
jgi:hypothetical protein